MPYADVSVCQPTGPVVSDREVRTLAAGARATVVDFAGKGAANFEARVLLGRGVLPFA